MRISRLAAAVILVPAVFWLTVPCTAAGGCGGCGGGSAKADSKADPAKELKLTADQQKKLAEIEKKYNAEVEKRRADLTEQRGEVSKLIKDPDASERSIRKAMYRFAAIQADLQLAGIFARREKDKLYTPQQKVILAKAPAGGCGCGSGGKGTASCGGSGSAPKGCAVESASTGSSKAVEPSTDD